MTTDDDRSLEEVIDELNDRLAADKKVLAPPSAPMAVAREYVTDFYLDDNNVQLLRRHAGGFYRYDGVCWPELDDADLRSSIYKWTEPAFYWHKVADEMQLVPWHPNKHKIGDVDDALRAVVHLDADTTPPAWIINIGVPRETLVDAHEVVAMANGLLHLPTRTLLAHTPAFFVHYGLGFDYDLRAPIPKRWLDFLRELWGDDTESIETLQEIFGYVLAGETRLQKIFLLVGPKRSGKGTIGRVLTGLLGRHNVAAPTFSGMCGDFGLAVLIDRPLALVSDARLSGKTDSSVVVERLLSISGEDTITINRKYKDHWTGRLPSRFVILSNELPRLSDSSGALASRLVILLLTESFYGREDPLLTDTLLTEASGIFNWALEGLDRLVDRGYFVQPTSAQEHVEALHDLASPVQTFVRERCKVGPSHSVLVDDLYRAWREWSLEQGAEHVETKNTFGRDLRAVVPGLHKQRAGTDARAHRYLGIGLS